MQNRLLSIISKFRFMYDALPAFLSAREMSLDIGQNPEYINHIELGQGVASLPVFFNICEHLNVTPSEFFDYGTEAPAKMSSIHELLKKPDYQQLNILEGLIRNMIK